MEFSLVVIAALLFCVMILLVVIQTSVRAVYHAQQVGNALLRVQCDLLRDLRHELKKQ